MEIGETGEKYVKICVDPSYRDGCISGGILGLGQWSFAPTLGLKSNPIMSSLENEVVAVDR